MFKKLKKFFKSPERSPIGTYRIDVLSLPEECDWEKYLPIEIRYIFSKHPEYKEKIRSILSKGKAIGVRTVLRTPENILKAVHTISVHSQGNYILSWLPELLRNKHYPTITQSDSERALEHKEDLGAAVETIVRDRLQFKKLVLIDEENVGITPEEQKFMNELSELLYPLAVDYAVFRVIADNAKERTEVASTIVKALVVVGPIAHILEHFASGIGKIFAASADDLLGETAELLALRGSGFSWKELAKRCRILIPIFALATYGAYSVEGLLEQGHVIWAGSIFGLSAVALSLTTAIQSIFLYRKRLQQLIIEKKYQTLTKKELIWFALRQDFTNPARLGLFIGAAFAPVIGIIGAVTGLMSNGWVLAAIGSTESIVAGITVILGDRINELRFRRKLHKQIS
jgi:hypothetical protein